MKKTLLHNSLKQTKFVDNRNSDCGYLMHQSQYHCFRQPFHRLSGMAKG